MRDSLDLRPTVIEDWIHKSVVYIMVELLWLSHDGHVTTLRVVAAGSSKHDEHETG